MPVTSSMVGLQGSPVTEVLEDRWVTNYAAAVGDTNPVYFDNRVPAPLPAHPAYLSHLEWDAIGRLHEEELTRLTDAERVLGVHTHNATRLTRPLTVGDTLTARAAVVGVHRHRAGALVTMRIDTVDAAGATVAVSHTTTLFRGVDTDTDAAPPTAARPPRPVGDPLRTEAIEIGRLAPFVFSECARDYGPIHTDLAVASAAGLPGLILHGTGTLAYVLSALTNTEAGGDPRRVSGFEARLREMVLCPSVLTLRVFPGPDPHTVLFDALTGTGATAVADGVLTLHRGAPA